MAQSSRNFLVTLTIIGLLGLVGVLEMKRQAVAAQLQQLTVRMEQVTVDEEAAKNQELANQIIAEVRALIDMPTDIEPTVATIVDIDALRARNPFYNKAENGDHLVVTPDRAILYSSSRKKIIDVVPVQLEQAKAAPAAPAEAEGSAE